MKSEFEMNPFQYYLSLIPMPWPLFRWGQRVRIIASNSSYPDLDTAVGREGTIKGTSGYTYCVFFDDDKEFPYWAQSHQIKGV